jgi:hypothetical protein
MRQIDVKIKEIDHSLQVSSHITHLKEVEQ